VIERLFVFLPLLLLASPAWAADPPHGPAGLDDPDPRVRILTIRGLAADPTALDVLAGHLAHEADPAAHRAIQDALARLPLDEAALLDALAHSGVPTSRAWAAHALGQSRTDAAVRGLLAAIADPEASVRVEVYNALGATGDRIALDTLVRAAVRDPSSAGRDAASAAAEVLAAAPTVPPDVPIDLARLKNGTRDDRLAAARRLGDTGDRRALEPLVAVATSGEDAELQRAAIGALGRLGDARAVPALLPLLTKTTGRTRYEVLGALAALRDESAVEPVARLLSDGDPAARQLAVRALGWIAPEDLFARLAPAQADPVDDVRGEVLLVVGESRAPTRVGALQRGLGDPSPFLRAEAVRLCAEAGVTDKIPSLLQDGDPLVRLAAAEALGTLRPPGAADALRAAAARANDADERARMIELADLLTPSRLPAGAVGQ
jgi:HEAT repeat protein